MQFKYNDLVKFQHYTNSESVDGIVKDNYRTLVGNINQVTDNFLYVKVDDWFAPHLTLQYYHDVLPATQEDLNEFKNECAILFDKNFK